IFPQFHAFLTHLPLVSSFRLSFTSSASNAFFCQFAVLRTGKLSSFYVKKRDLSVSAHRILFTCLATSYSCGTYVRLPSALRSLTSVFGMGTGVTSLL